MGRHARLGLLVTILLVTGCARASSPDFEHSGLSTSGPSGSASVRDVRCWGFPDGGVASTFSSLSEVLPNTLVRLKGVDAGPQSMTDLVVVGHIVDVVEGRAWSTDDDQADDGHDGTVVPFDDPSADWKHVLATVAVDDVLAPRNVEVQQVLVAFALNGDETLQFARDQLLDGQQLVLPLYQWEGTSYRTDLWSVGPANDSFVVEVADDETLSLPCLKPDDQRRLLRGIATLDALLDVAHRPMQVISRKPLALA